MASAVIQNAKFSVHVFAHRRSDQAGRYCHFRRADGRPETILGLPALETVLGPELAPQEWELVPLHLQEILDAWEKRNG